MTHKKGTFSIPEVDQAAPEEIQDAEFKPVTESKDKTDFSDNPLGPILTEAIESQPKVRKKHVHEEKGKVQGEVSTTTDTSAHGSKVDKKKSPSGL
ncbi:MAG: hypothetical protein KC422_25260, partial [Trueperaceae bacterium]|nr:hypothetical protein [Trueperaceae bacterium]